MDEKPVIIIGGGLWGTLLALRIREILPEIPLKLYAEGGHLGEKLAVSFHESDVEASAMKWLLPLVSRHWKAFDVSFPKYSRRNEDAVFTMEPLHFHAVASRELEGIVHYHRSPSPEEALREGAFVIDTLSRGYFRALGYQKSTGLVVKLLHPHRQSVPVTMDTTVGQNLGFRYLQTLPLSEDTLLVKDVRFSTDPQLYFEDLEPDLLRELHTRRLLVGDILERESEFRKIPCTPGDNFTEGRVIRLDGLVHDVTGDALPDAVRLIDRMVKTSFRLGELQEVMRAYGRERNSYRRVLRLMNRVLYRSESPCHERYQFFQSLHAMPPAVRRKFYKGELEALDVARTLIDVRLLGPLKGLFELNKKQERVATV